MKKRIMIFCDSYLPGYQGGGGMRAVYNLADNFKDEYDFFIVTRDCDGKADQTPFIHAARDKWNTRPEAEVYYASPAKISRKTFKSLIEEISPDLIYLNSVFSYVCVKFLFTRRRSRLYDIPIIVAPCGEFSPAALQIKSAKKQSFLTVARVSQLFEQLNWKAANDIEKADITHVVDPQQAVFVASELVPKEILPGFEINEKPIKESGKVNLIYYARITPIKNLLFVLDLLSNLSEGEVNLNVVGPPENEEYYTKCLAAAKTLPSNIKINFLGGQQYESGLNELINNHVMIMPTKSENFGYVVIEAFAAGNIVIASDQVPWNLESNLGVLTRISLDNEALWLDAIKDTIYTDDEIFRQLALNAREIATCWLSTNHSKEAWKSMFSLVLAGSTKDASAHKRRTNIAR